MMDKQLEDALTKFRKMDSKTANEAAHSYLLNVLKIYSENKIGEKLKQSFENEADFFEAETVLKLVRDTEDENHALIQIAVEATLQSNPDTKALFIESVESAGEKLFVVEVAVVAIAAALLLKTYYQKGKDTEETIEKYNDKGTLIEKVSKIKFSKDSTLAGLLFKLGAKFGLGVSS